MSLTWSDPMPPASGEPSYYDHVIAKTPLGDVLIEWKSWKEHDVHGAEMPWGEFVSGFDIDDAKQKVQASWDVMALKVAELSTKP